MNTGAPWPTAEQAQARVLEIQAKLHRWATDDPDRRFADLFNLVGDPAVLLVAWRRVKGNKGARTAGVDGQTVYYIQQRRGEESFLAELRAELKARRFRPLPMRERLLPKPGSGKLRMAGDPHGPCIGPARPARVRFRTRFSSSTRSTRWPGSASRSSWSGAAREPSLCWCARVARPGG